MPRIERQHQRELPPEERKKNFEEVALGYTLEQAKTEASRCLSCKHAPCVKGCPVNVQIPQFIAALKEGDIDKANRIIKQTNNLPGVCGRVCPQETQCEVQCLRNKLEGPVAIGTLERFAADNADQPTINKAEKKCGKKAAVIGSGPAGLTCAADLAAAGVDVTIFEAFHLPGGVLVYGIPEFRLPKKLVQKEIDELVQLGVKIETNTVIGKTILMEELLEEFDAIFISTGAGLPQFMGIAGENLNGVYSANEYLTRVNLMKAYRQDAHTPVYKGKNVAVLGAGNVAMDAARTAVRLGADSVRIVYRRGREEMPARVEEVRHAEEEGVIFELLTNPLEIEGEGGRVKGMRCVRMQLGEPDASGRRRPLPIPGTEFLIECDQVIVAIGTSPNPLLKDSFSRLATTQKGTIIVDEESMRTNVEKVYAGGDAVTGAATVILAMGAGKKAARHMLMEMGSLPKE
ncbi:MAG: NADPH-dependent glutamate synthase [Clostridiales bacterium]|nr:NADPH-dependent glutamate synthase [Clostridiales bacterium]